MAIAPAERREPEVRVAAPPRADLTALPPAAGPEEQLAARAAGGDAAAFDELVLRFSDRVFGVAYRMLGDRAEAEDLAQEVFVTLYHSLASFRGEAKLSTWIYRITRNRCLNRIKFLKRRHIGQHADIDDPHVAPATIDAETRTRGKKDPSQKLEGDELSALLQEHLLLLTGEQRTLVVLRDLEDLTYEEIVDVTGLPLGTVKSRLHRARSALARSLEEHRDELEQHL